MTDIVAQSADGQYHSFPEGTNPSVVDKVMKQYAADHAPPSSVTDAIRAIPGGLAQGAAAVLGLPGDVQGLMNKADNYLFGAKDPGTSFPTSQTINNVISKPFGGYYQPKTTAGKYAETIASFAPAALAPGGMAARAARVVLPAVTSETAGELTQSTPLEAPARIIGGIAGGVTGGLASGIGPSIARAAQGAANLGSEAALGVPLRNPTATAEGVLRGAVARDGGPSIANQNAASFQSTGTPYSLVDVGGGNVRRTVRAAAATPQGDAGNTAQSYVDRIAANLHDRATGQARQLTPTDTRPANVVREDLATTRGNLAQNDYAQPYSEPAAVTGDMVSALQGDAGRKAIGRAYQAAADRRDLQQMGELSDLKQVAADQSGGTNIVTGKRQTLDQALANLSAGSLDRVRIAMRETGNALYESGARDRAAGYKTRVNDIDTALDQTPGLADARKTYRDYSNRIAGLDLGSQAVNLPSNEYAWQLGDLAAQTPRLARQAAGIGHRTAIVNGIQNPAAGSTGFLNRLASSENQTQNLQTSFGNPATQQFQQGIANETARLKNARFINPNTGSQTEPRMAERALVDLVSSKVGLATRIFDTFKQGTALTPREKAELVRLGTSENDVHRLIAGAPAKADPRIAIASALANAELSSTQGQRQPDPVQ